MVRTSFKIVKTSALVLGIGLTVSVGGLASGKIQQTSSTTQISLNEGETGQANYISSGDGFVLEGGLKVKLAGIEAPQKAWPEKNIKAQPLSDEASDCLSDLIKGKTIGLFYAGDPRDRFGRALAQVWTLDEAGQKDIWVQEAMVRAGYARVYAWREKDYGTAALYEAERAARKPRKGIWNNRRTKSFYKIRKPAENALIQKVDSIQIVEGVIVSSADVKGTVYLNFGADYKTDFTIGIGKKSRRAFERAGIDPVALEGARVRVRGWLEMQNGPMIWVNTPSRLEIVE